MLHRVNGAISKQNSDKWSMFVQIRNQLAKRRHSQKK